MSFPARFTVGVHTFSEGAEDSHGIPEKVFTPPLDQPGAPHAVICWAPAGGDGEPKLAGHDRVVVDIEMAVPEGFPVGPRDVIDLPEGPQGQFEVIGYPEDANNGFHGWRPGLVVNLKRVEG